jgi:nitronate monooxygenase
MILDELRAPIVLAPLAGGPSTPQLAAAVSDAGALGFLAFGYLSAEEGAERLAATRALTNRPFGVNVFAPVGGPADPTAYEGYVERLRAWARRRDLEPGEPRYSDDDFAAKIELLVSERVAVVSFTFGCPEWGVIRRLQESGSEVWVTITTPAEAEQAAGAGADALVVQGAEAGGHRGSFADGADVPVFGLLPLLQLISAAQRGTLVASGGIATGGAIAAALCAGATAVQLGTAFMLCPEAGTAQAHRTALRSDRGTALTRAFTGRTARGIRNAFMDEHDSHAPFAYPELHYVTAPLRRASREAGDDSAINLWAGEAHQLARDQPAGEVVRELMRDARRASASTAGRLAVDGQR